jgi:hypothetical protein
VLFAYNRDRIIVIYIRKIKLDIDDRDRNDHRKSVSEFTRVDLSISIWSEIAIIDRDDGDSFEKYRSPLNISEKPFNIRGGGGCLIFEKIKASTD